METALTISRANQSRISCVRVRGRTNIFCADQGFWSEWTQECFSGMQLKVTSISFTSFVKPVWDQALMAAMGTCWCPALEVGSWFSYTPNLRQHSYSYYFASPVHLGGKPKNTNASAPAPFPAARGWLWWRSDCFAREGTWYSSLSAGHPPGCPPPWISSFAPCRPCRQCALALLQDAEGREEAQSGGYSYMQDICYPEGVCYPIQ